MNIRLLTIALLAYACAVQKRTANNWYCRLSSVSFVSSYISFTFNIRVLEKWNINVYICN